jgi:hypothetical protein
MKALKMKTAKKFTSFASLKSEDNKAIYDSSRLKKHDEFKRTIMEILAHKNKGTATSNP